jgi:hypothetical protein
VVKEWFSIIGARVNREWQEMRLKAKGWMSLFCRSSAENQKPLKDFRQDRSDKWA